jgi:hypothetical protein
VEQNGSGSARGRGSRTEHRSGILPNRWWSTLRASMAAEGSGPSGTRRRCPCAAAPASTAPAAAPAPGRRRRPWLSAASWFCSPAAPGRDPRCRQQRGRLRLLPGRPPLFLPSFSFPLPLPFSGGGDWIGWGRNQAAVEQGWRIGAPFIGRRG